MGATLSIRTILAEMAPGQIFTSRDFVGAGSRAAVDKCLSRLAESGSIQRIARGVFSNGKAKVAFDALDVARIKAEAFNKEIFEHPVTTAQRLGYIQRAGKNDDLIVATNGGSSSSFRLGTRVIHLKAVCARKRREDKNEVWELLKSLWHIGRGKLNSNLRRHIMNSWSARTQSRLDEYRACVPHWLLDEFPHNLESSFTALYMKNVPFAYDKLYGEQQQCLADDAEIAALRMQQEELAAEMSAYSKGFCSCFDSDEGCICPIFTCSYCQERPLSNKFRVA